MLEVKIGQRFWEVNVGHVSLPGKGHDAWAVGVNSAAVVDGATPLSSDWPQDLRAFAKRAAEALITQSEVGANRQSPNVWADVIRTLAYEFPPAGYKRTAGAAVVRSLGDLISFSTLGDVMCLIQTDAGSIRLLDPTLPMLDDLALTCVDRASALYQHRQMANSPNGYAVLGDNLAASERALNVDFEAHTLKQFWLMTDGIWRQLPDDPEKAVSVMTSAPEFEYSNLLRRTDDDATVLAFRAATVSSVFG